MNLSQCYPLEWRKSSISPNYVKETDQDTSQNHLSSPSGSSMTMEGEVHFPAHSGNQVKAPFSFVFQDSDPSSSCPTLPSPPQPLTCLPLASFQLQESLLSCSDKTSSLPPHVNHSGSQQETEHQEHWIFLQMCGCKGTPWGRCNNLELVAVELLQTLPKGRSSVCYQSSGEPRRTQVTTEHPQTRRPHREGPSLPSLFILPSPAPPSPSQLSFTKPTLKPEGA